MKETAKSIGGSMLIVLGTLIVLGLVISYLPKVLTDRLPRY